jgi:hypothetical protein
MGYRSMAWLHVRIAAGARSARDGTLARGDGTLAARAGAKDARARERGQGTVEYVALILLVAALLAGVVAATKGTKFGTGSIAETIVKQIKNALDSIK